MRADEVLLDREQERLVLREFDELTLRFGGQLPVSRDLGNEARRTARPGKRGHPKEDPASVLVLEPLGISRR